MARRDDVDQIEVWLLNTEDPLTTVRTFGEEANIEGVMLYDAKEPYNRYYPVETGDDIPYAPYPMHVVLDPSGRIQLVSHQYDSVALNDALDAALAE